MDIRKKFFMMRVMKHLKRVPREVVNAPLLEVLNQVGWYLEQLNLVKDVQPPPCGRVSELDDL